MIQVNLANEQLQAMEGVMFLFIPKLGIGKTYLMAYCFIKTAIDNPNEWIYYYDHNPVEYKRMRTMIEKIALMTDEEIDVQSDAIRYTK